MRIGIQNGGKSDRGVLTLFYITAYLRYGGVMMWREKNAGAVLSAATGAQRVCERLGDGVRGARDDAARVQGRVVAVKESFGFIRRVDAPGDVYFPVLGF